ncbi:uncharacterized protein LOC132707153 [Cylas formicarius]|uniref:uncharacterized protein LOC132707153 n=1 Tax=Cylas formicarius TaxID=197179 RepID=UPI0029589757|nr:uncharacterized protein LOC132707153 [Cylas formicarius]
MAKETTIIFVYDTERPRTEHDEPSSAILYFHPTWVSDQQKTALCGQIIGTITCARSIFGAPRVVGLQTGKFYVVENGRYILAVGTDRNVADWLLEHRATLLYSLVNFFNKDFETLGTLYRDEALTAKLYHMFETYLRMLFFGGNIFSHVPLLCLPKSASSVFTEAMTFLEACQQCPHVLGGALLYHNKVVGTQLPIDVTKRVVIADPYRIKSPAEPAGASFDLPLGVQLLQVYVSNDVFCDMLETSLRDECVFQYLNNKSVKTPHADSVPVGMKRDQSLLFTAVPEEGSAEIAFVPSQKKQRPKFLNLRSFSADSRATPVESTPVCGRTSVASTPMTELRRFVHQNPLTLIEKEGKRGGPENDAAATQSGPPVRRSASVLHLREVLDGIVKNVDLGRFDAKTWSASPKRRARRRSTSIHDPTVPLLKPDGIAVSRERYERLLERDGEALLSVARPPPVAAPKPTDGDAKPRPGCPDDGDADKIPKERRRSLVLPLKPISGVADAGSSRKPSLGVQLTPLMSKLSVLAFEEQRGVKDAPPTPFVHNRTKEVKNLRLENASEPRRCVLFVCGQQDVVASLLMKEECCKDEDAVLRIWEMCTEHLGQLEKRLSFCLESSGTSAHESEPYSFLCLDAKWDTVKRGGPWGTGDLAPLVSLHRDFADADDVTEILLRAPDCAVYGYRCGPSEVFYHEGAGPASGLPLPSDPVGLIQTKARRRLERDHAVLLL